MKSVFHIIFNYLQQELKFRFTTKICYCCKDELFPFDSGWLSIGTRIKFICWLQKDLHSMSTPHFPSGQDIWQLSQNFQHLTGHYKLSVRQALCKRLSLIHTQFRLLLQEPPAPLNLGQVLSSVFHMGSYARLHLSRYHIM